VKSGNIGVTTAPIEVMAKYAIDQNKELFAIPGEINNALSEGPNYLIKNGACMVTEADDILSSFINTNYVEQLTIFPELSNEEKVVYNYIKQENRSVYFDEIIINTKLPVTKLSALLMNLELKGVIQAQAGNKYIFLY
jgi:DNA processing protein